MEFTEKGRRKLDRATLAPYHEARLAELLERVRQGLADLDADKIDAFELDDVINHYSRAAGELSKFCAVSGEQASIAVRTLELWQERGEVPDWWEAARRHRR